MYSIEVKVKEIESKENGNKFNIYKLVTKSKKLVDVRFTKNVTNLPKEDCVMVVKPENINYDKNRQFPCFWVKEIEEIKPIIKIKGEDLGEYFD